MSSSPSCRANDAGGASQADLHARLAQLEAENAELRRKAAMLDALMEQLPEGITIASGPEVTIERVSAHGLRRLRRPMEEVGHIGAERHPQAWQVLDAAGTRLLAADELPLTRATRQGEVVENERLNLRLADGSLLPILCNAGPIRDAEGRITGGVIFWRDISELVRTEAALREQEARLRFVVASSPDNIFLQDRSLRYVWMAKPVVAVPEADYLGRTDHDLVDDPAEAAHLVAIKQRVMAEGRGTRVELSLTIKGARHDFEARYEPWRDAAGEVAGVLGYVRDVTTRRAADAALRASEAMLSAVLDALPVGVIISDAAGRILRDNAANRELWGGAPETGGLEDFAKWVGFWPATGKRIAPAEWGLARALLKGEIVRGELVECQRFDTAERRFFLNNAAPIRDAAGRLVGGVAAELDVTERRRAEQHRELLLNELTHRVKNTLATVQSVVAQSLRAGCPEDVRRVLQDRLISMARAHDVLTAEHWEGAGLREVAQAVLQPYLGEGMRILIEGPEVRLGPKAALALSMAFHELATNAVKHGALSVETGRIHLCWNLAVQRLHLTWRESGGPAVQVPKRRGFGSRLLERGLAHDLAAEIRLDFAADGLVCEVTAPLPSLRSDGGPGAGA